jgi:hypothetical protein
MDSDNAVQWAAEIRRSGKKPTRARITRLCEKYHPINAHFIDPDTKERYCEICDAVGLSCHCFEGGK